MEEADAAGLEALDRVLFFAYIRHLVGPKGFLEDAIAAQMNDPRTVYFVGLVLPNDHKRLIGILIAIITQISKGAYSLEIGYALAPDQQKRGSTRSALLVFLSRVLTPEVIELTATVDPDNLSSIRLLERCGFQHFHSVEKSKYLGDPDDPSHYEDGVLQMRPRVEFRAKADGFR